MKTAVNAAIHLYGVFKAFRIAKPGDIQIIGIAVWKY